MKQPHYAEIGKHFDRVAPDYIRLKGRNRYYHRRIEAWLKSNIAPQQKVLEMGCGVGDVLAQVRAKKGIGIDLSPAMLKEARDNHPAFEFIQGLFEDFDPKDTFDCILAVNTVEYAYDVSKVLSKANELLRDSGKLCIVTANPIWSGIFKLASRLGLRQPDCKRLFLTNLDLANMLKINGFEVVSHSMGLVLPKYIPIFGNAINWLFARLPLLRLLGSTQFLIARKIPKTAKPYAVSIVIPCHNEAQNIKSCIARVQKIGKSTEIVFVDDGSSDGTLEEIKRNQGNRKDIQVNYLNYQPNRGKGHAVKAGLDSAQGDILLILDADISTEPEEFEQVYKILSDGLADFVNCTRMVYPMAQGAMPTLNYIGNKLFNILVSLIMESRVSDTLCGTKAFFKRDYQYFEMGRDPWGDYDLLFGAAKLRLAIAEYPIHYQERLAGTSKMKPLKHGLNLLRMCLNGFRDIKFSRPIEIRNQVHF